MGRMTRAKAAEVAEKLHMDEDAVLDLPSENGGVNIKTQTPEEDERTVLGEIANNSGGSRADEDSETTELKKSTRGRKAGKKNAKAKKNNLAASTATVAEQAEQSEAVFEDEASLSPASEAAETSSKQGPSVAVSTPEIDETQSRSPAVRLTRSQLAKSTNAEQPVLKSEVASPAEQPVNATSHHDTPEPKTAMAPRLSPLPSATPKVIASLRRGTPGMRSTSNKENVEPIEFASPTPAASLTPRLPSNYDALEDAVVSAATPPEPSRRPSAAELPTSTPSVKQSEPEPVVAPAEATASPTEAMDALDDALEKVSAELPDIQASPAKAKKEPVKPQVEQSKSVKKAKAAPVVRTTKASQARISMAQEDKSSMSKTSSTARPRPSAGLARSGSIRQSMLSRSEPAAAAKRVPSVGSKKPASSPNDEPREKKETVIPHSKPRPVSLSFPTPPPPPKSKKAPTQSTFQLPGEAIAAKLKAAREERMKKEAEDAERKKAEFKARPVPAGLKKAPSVRQTNASRARESVMGGKPITAPAAGGPHKRANSVATSSVAKRTSVLGALSSTSSAGLKPEPAQLKVAKRPSTAFASTSVSRSYIAPAAAAAPASGQRTASGKGTTKGKEVFNRAAAAKDAAEKEKREKEEVAKKARAAAAERGRQASREWAEKQRLKKLGLKPTPDAKNDDVVKVEGAAPADEMGVSTPEITATEVAAT